MPTSARRSIVFAGALLACSLVHCAMRSDGIGVDVAVDASMPAARGDGALVRLSLELAEVTLVPCPAERSADVWPSLLAPARALAHGDVASLAGQVVFGAGRGESLGTLEPRPGHYCDLRLVVRGAEALVIEGWRSGAPIEARVSIEREHLVALRDADGARRELVLDAAHPRAALWLEMDGDAALEALEAGQPPDVLGARVVGALLRSARVLEL